VLKLLLTVSLLMFFAFCLKAQVEFSSNGVIYRGLIIRESSEQIRILNDKLDTMTFLQKDIHSRHDLICAITRMTDTSAENVQIVGRVEKFEPQKILFREQSGAYQAFHPGLIKHIQFFDKNNEKLYSIGVSVGYPIMTSLNFGIKSIFGLPFGSTLRLGFSIDKKSLYLFPMAGIYYSILNRKHYEWNAGICILSRSAGIYSEFHYGPFWTGLDLTANSNADILTNFNLGLSYRFN